MLFLAVTRENVNNNVGKCTSLGGDKRVELDPRKLSLLG